MQWYLNFSTAAKSKQTMDATLAAQNQDPMGGDGEAVEDEDLPLDDFEDQEASDVESSIDKLTNKSLTSPKVKRNSPPQLLKIEYYKK